VQNFSDAIPSEASSRMIGERVILKWILRIGTVRKGGGVTKS